MGDVSPVLVYYKNALINKYMKTDNPVNDQVTQFLRDGFELFGLQYYDLFTDVKEYSSGGMIKMVKGYCE